MTVNRRTITVLAIIAVILVAVFGITRWQRSVATKKLLADMTSKDYAKVMDAMNQLKDRGGSITPALLNEEHLGSSYAPARWRAATLLGEVGNRSAVEPLKGALKDEIPSVRAAAALALGKMGAKDAASDIQALLAAADEDVAVRIAAARALGLDCGPMSGFDNKTVDELFLSGTTWKSNFLINLGYGDASKLHPRAPRLHFDEACKVV